MKDLSATPLSYPEQGATSGEMPSGYHHMRRTAVIGYGRAAFDAAARRLFSWQMHRGAGLRVTASGPPAEGRVVQLRLGPFSGCCRVVYVVDEPHRRGFAYGTLRGHPERGEEFFGVRFDPTTATVYADIVAFSRPGRWWSRLAAAPAGWLQRRVTDRYLRALTSD